MLSMMCTLDKEALFLGLEKSCSEEAILFHKSSQVCFPRVVLSASLLFHVPQVLISEKNSKGTLSILLSSQMMTEEMSKILPFGALG